MKLEFCIDDFCGILRISSEFYQQEIKDILRVGRLKNGTLVYYTDSTVIDERIKKSGFNPEPPEKWLLGDGDFVRIGTSEDCEILRSRWNLINHENDRWYIRFVDWLVGKNRKMDFLSATN